VQECRGWCKEGHGRDLGVAAALLNELSVVVGGPFKVCYPSPALSQGALLQNEVMWDGG
jgi:hypothetical protein